jgi:hypothetical protein
LKNFPEIDVSESKKDDNWIAQYIDAAIDFHEKNASDREVLFENIYDSYNGVRKSIGKNYITKRYGKESKVPFIRYNYGRTKTKVLLGEMLSLKFDGHIEALNPQAKTEKLRNRAIMKGAMYAKKELMEVQKETGIDVLNGAEIPEVTDPLAEDKIMPRLETEKYLQIILEEKIETEKIVQRAFELFTDLVLVSECHAIIKRNSNDVDTLEFIPSKNAIFMETPNDPFCERSPFHGHKEYMYLHQILRKWPKLTDTQIEEIKSSNDFAEKDITKSIGGETAYPVYYIEFFSPKPIYTKISPSANSNVPYHLNIKPEWYESDKNKNKIKKDVESGKYGFTVQYGEQMFKGYRIGQTVHIDLGRKENVIQRNKMGKYRAESDYIHLLFGTVNNLRISIQELIYNLDEVYDVLMWQIVREIRKLKGSVLVYDEALTPKNSSFSSVMFDMTEEGVVKVNSIEEGNYYARDVLNAAELVKKLDLGPGTTLNDLVSMKIAIEKTIDRITGVNEEREGLSSSSQTATGTIENINASRNITKDIYFFLNEFMEKSLLKLLEKTKLNRNYLERLSTKFKYGDNLVEFMKILDELPLTEIGLKLTDGKEVEDIKSRVRHLFAQEINSQSLRTKDVIEFELSKTITQGLSVLDKAWELTQSVANKQMEEKSKLQNESQQFQLELAREDREDRQEHEKELLAMKLQGDAFKTTTKSLSDERKIDLEEKNINQQI